MLTERTYDALVVGARCAGAATAMLMARRGLRVLLIDRAGYGTDTVSTHALMRGSVLQLHRWGLLSRVQTMGTPAVRQTTFHYGDEVIPVPIKPSAGVGALYAPRRTLLDSILVDAARGAGVVVRHGYSLVGMTHRRDGRVCGAQVQDAAGNVLTLQADLVVGADGAGSSVARLVSAPTMREGRHATALVFGYFPGIELTDYHWWYQPGLGAGVIPTNQDRHCVFLAMPPWWLRRSQWRTNRPASFRQALTEVDPALAALVADAEPDAPLSVFAGRTGFLRQAFGPGWALVGDAGYFRDPLTAHGITDALRDAELLANAAVMGKQADFAGYAATRDTLSVPLFDVSDAIAALDWDLEQIKALHHTLNQVMKREVEHLLALGDAYSFTMEEELL